jgi:hypothetical protein
MKVYYILGPYKAPTQYERELNIRAAEHTSIRVLRETAGGVICPHTMGRYWFEYAPEERILGMCRELLLRSDAVVLSQGLSAVLRSAGSVDELQLAIDRCIPVFLDPTSAKHAYPLDRGGLREALRGVS